MDSLVIHAASRDSAEGFCSALSALRATLIQGENGRYRVEIPVDGDREILAVLSAIESYVCARADGPARLDLDGHRYTLHPTDAS